MALLYYTPQFLEHDTGPHPECAARLLPTVRQLQQSDYLFPMERPSVRAVTPERLQPVHPASYVARIQEIAAQGGGTIDDDTVVSSASFDVARLAAGAVCDAVVRVLDESDQCRALCLVRPPGHHALRDQAMGFCLFNNVAVGALVATDEFDLERVLIIDWDVHHGNGTQAIFWEDPRIGFLSIHRHPFYPETGAADEIGSGPGLGMTVNIPLPVGTPRPDYLAAFRTAVERFADRIKPQLILISAGFDAHRLDPVGSLGLESEDFAELTRVVVAIAKTHAAGRIVSVLEGGYHPHALAESIEAHVHELCIND